GHLERSDIERRIPVDNVQLYLSGKALLLQLFGDEPGSEWRGVERRLQFACEIGDRADMILVTVRQNDARQPVLPGLDELKVRQDQVDARIVRVGEGQSQVYHQPLAAGSIKIDVHADFARTTERAEQQFFAWSHLSRRRPIVEQAQPLDRQVGLNGIEQVRVLVEQRGKTASCKDSDGSSDLRLQSSNQAFHHCDIAPVDSGQHLGFGRST